MKRITALLMFSFISATTNAAPYVQNLDIQSYGLWFGMTKTSPSTAILYGITETDRYSPVERKRLSKRLGMVVKIDFDGEVIWEYSFRPSDLDVWDTHADSLDDGGLCILSNVKDSKENGQISGALLKVDSKGKLLWQKILYEKKISLPDHRYRVSGAKDGGCVVFGATNTEQGKHPSLKIGKYAANGDLVYLKEYPDITAMKYSIVKEERGGYTVSISYQMTDEDMGNIMTGKKIRSKNIGDIAVIRIHESGEIAWRQNILNYKGHRRIYSSVKTGRAYLLAGYKKKHNKEHSWLVKIKDNGTLLWEKTLKIDGVKPSERVIRNIEEYGRNYLLSRSCGRGSCLTLIDGNGETIWNKAFVKNGYFRSSITNDSQVMALIYGPGLKSSIFKMSLPKKQ